MVRVQSVPLTPWSLAATALTSPRLAIASSVQPTMGLKGLPLEIETMLLVQLVADRELVNSQISPRSVYRAIRLFCSGVAAATGPSTDCEVARYR